LTVHDPAKKRASRRKGAVEERALVRFLRQQGLNATKISRTGYAGSDLAVDLLGISRSVEVKVRARAFGQLYRMLGTADLLIVRQDRKPALCICPLWLASEVAAEAEGHVSPTQRQLAALTKKQERDRVAATQEGPARCPITAPHT
jgi:Holliday junction resolvase